MRSLQEYLEEAAAYHGHLCAGQVLGVRMSIAALKWLGIDEPKSYKRLIVYVEIDRCATDAIHSVTGCKLGKRSLKHVDYGKMAATFVDQITNRAVRVHVPEHTRELAKQVFPDRENPFMDAYMIMPDDQLLQIEEVRVEIPPFDLPGKPLKRVYCDHCQEGINDGREVMVGRLTLCRGCISPSNYYQKLESSPVPELDQWIGMRAELHHQAGMNGAQSVLQALMDGQIIPKMPALVEMTAVWKGGVCGQVCSALAAGTLALGTSEQSEGQLCDFQDWFRQAFGAQECKTITDQVGGRPSATQKAYCDQICQKTASYITKQMTFEPS